MRKGEIAKWVYVTLIFAWLIWVALHELPEPIEIIEIWGW